MPNIYGIILSIKEEESAVKDVIVVYPVRETAMSIRALIERGGFHVSHICALGASALKISQTKKQGIIVCPFVMRDMSSAELANSLPVDFDVVALSKNGTEQYMGNMITLPLPIDSNVFLRTIGLLVSSKSGFTKRGGDDDEYISKAKQALMSLMGMSETQAHKYLQRESMKSGKKIVRTAMDILERLA